MKKLLLIASLLLAGLTAFGQMSDDSRVSLSGFIRDAGDKEPMFGATVFAKENYRGTAADENGFYRLELKPGNYTIEYSFIGYAKVTKTVELNEDTRLDVYLSVEGEELTGVVIDVDAKQNVESVEMSKIELDIKEIKIMPALMGEVDVIKSIQLLPGVQTGGEGTSGFFVRGGAADQNLVLLDGATVYNASHLMGFFSVFNPDAVSGLQLYKGGIPAEYGGRLASVLDITTLDGGADSFSGQGGIGTVSSRMTLLTPFDSGRGTLMVAGRRSYADVFLQFDPDFKGSQLYFGDLNIKSTYKIDSNDKVSFAGYMGRDVFGESGFSIKWGNTLGTANWEHYFNRKWFLNVNANYTDYDYALGSTEEDFSFEWASQVKDYGGKVGLTYLHAKNNKYKFGVQGTRHAITPADIHSDESSLFNDFKIDPQLSNEWGAYLSNERKYRDRLTVIYGLRYSMFQNVGPGETYAFDANYNVTDTIQRSKGVYNTYDGLEPRLGLNYSLTTESAIKASYNRTYQYLQLASNSTASSPFDIWFPASPNIKPQVADQFAVGYFRNFKDNMYEASVELYYKDMQNQIDFKDHAQLLLNRRLEGEMRIGNAYSYGAEFFIKKRKGRLTGWLSYTYARVFRTIPEINHGKKYSATYDKPHDISIVAAYKLNKKWTLSTNWVYSTGAAVTMPTGRAKILNTVVPVYSDRNAERMPSYHRLDLGATKQGKTWKMAGREIQGEWVFSVYNAYFQKNPYTINFVNDPNKPDETYAEKLYLFGIVPSVTYNLTF